MRTRVLIAAAAASLVLLTACGSDSKSSAASTTGGADTSAPSTGGTETTTASTGSTGASTATTGTVNPEFADYCAQITDYKDNASAFDSVFSSNTPDPAKTEEAFTSMKDKLQSLADNAPDAIKADVGAVNEATGKVIDIFAKYEWDVIKLSGSGDDATKFQEILKDTAVNDASARLDTWGQENCGFAPGE
jgi:hypothetical protein